MKGIPYNLRNCAAPDIEIGKSKPVQSVNERGKRSVCLENLQNEVGLLLAVGVSKFLQRGVG